MDKDRERAKESLKYMSGKEKVFHFIMGVKHLKKYMEYKVSLQCQSGKPVVTVIICTYHIKSEVLIFKETETSILKPIVHYLVDYYDEVKYLSL